MALWSSKKTEFPFIQTTLVLKDFSSELSWEKRVSCCRRYRSTCLSQSQSTGTSLSPCKKLWYVRNYSTELPAGHRCEPVCECLCVCECELATCGWISPLKAPEFSSAEKLRMWRVLLSGVLLFPGLFVALRKTLPVFFRRWTDADVVLVSER